MKNLAGRTVTGSASARLLVDGVSYIYFLGAGYFALSNIPEEAARRRRYALESGAAFAQHVPLGVGCHRSSL